MPFCRRGSPLVVKERDHGSVDSCTPWKVGKPFGMTSIKRLSNRSRDGMLGSESHLLYGWPWANSMNPWATSKGNLASIICKAACPNERSAKPQLKNAISGAPFWPLGSKLSFLGLHYIVLPYILIASCASPGKLRAESLFTPPLQCLKHLWLPCAFFCSAPTVWSGRIHVNATANQLHQTSLNPVVGRSLDERSPRHVPCLSFTPQREKQWSAANMHSSEKIAISKW